MSLGLMVVFAGAVLWLAALTWPVAPAAAAPPVQDTTPPTSSPLSPPIMVSNETCLACHATAATTRLPSGEDLYLGIDPARYAASVHGSGGYLCTQCHTNISGYPHPPQQAQDLRGYAIANYELCKTCHADKYELSKDSVHQTALQAGNRQAAVCADCHDPHAQGRILDQKTHQPLPDAHLAIPQTCATCHNTIYEQYKTSVHGAALVDAQNPDVPTCIDCHGVHGIADPTSATFRLNSPSVCAKCHTDAARMDKYGISTQVMNTYLADFHGSTVTLFEKQAPDQLTNKPVCIDCHGFHDIKQASDPQKGLHVRENLVAQCQSCHPDANANFSEAWLSHYTPDREKYPIVYYVNLFYQIVIPTLIGGMVLFAAGDAGRRFLNRRRISTPPAAKGEKGA
ncbi:MAG: cytochrome c3 family protein [Anaerolineae bacterium]|nr:cytochrome c3 family protein [Anaerolineae bacterium]